MKKTLNKACGSTILLCFILALTDFVFSGVPNEKLAELRNEFAVNYLSPKSHFALANYYLEKGNKVQAFYIMEYARRYRFPQEDFDSEFVKFFGDNSPEPSDEAKKHFEEAYRLLKLDKYAEAEKSFAKSAELAQKSAMIQSWVGRFYLKVQKNNVKALEHYYKAYFLNPHAYDTEHAEYRIKMLTAADADTRFKKLVGSRKSLSKIARNDNPIIVMKAIRKMSKEWKPQFVKVFNESLDNDDSLVRWGVFSTLYLKSKPSSDKFISKLLNSRDLRKNGLAAYALVDRGLDEDFKVLKKMLKNKAQLVRFDAVSALALRGGKSGLKILEKHMKEEKHPYLRKLIKDKLTRQNESLK